MGCETGVTTAARPLDPPSAGPVTHVPHTPRPGTPIVTPRTSFQFHGSSASRSTSRLGSSSRSTNCLGSSSRPTSRLGSSSRPVSRLTYLGTPPEEEEEEEEREEENRHLQREDSIVTTLSATSLSSSSGGDNSSGLPESPESPSRGTPLPISPRLEERLRHSVSCFKRLIRSSSRTHTATSYRARHSRYCGCSSGHSIDEINMVDAKVIYASSQDPTFPPSAMLDGRPDTFWATSGLYPQMVVVTLPGITSVDALTILAYNVRRVSVARSIKTQPTDFEEVTERELPHDEGKLQSSVLSSEQITAAHLRITIIEGHGHFCSVHKVSVTGTASSGVGGGQPGSGFTKVTTNNSSPAVFSPPSHQRTRSPLQVMSKPNPFTAVGDDGDEDLPPADFTQNQIIGLPDDDEF
ncbi:Intraflagellar transport protein 25-like [Homarus americanus]|uniref:Intraflagellar transport protein 25-like n=1 Tax=Homarus americanus TaxID=6706 RepID=A0A8J5MHV6_HOMAM|nr:Intraflagellar transport protein 25-like [Homarus americanus]